MPFVLLSEIVSAIFCIALGVFAYTRNSRAVANRSFAAFNFALAIWTPSDLIKNVTNHHIALLTYRFGYIGGSFISLAFVGFMWSVIGYKNARIFRIIKWSAIMFAILSQTRWMIQDITINSSVNDPIGEIHGPAYIFFEVFFIFSLLYGAVPLAFRYSKSTGTQRKQIQHILFSFFLGLVAVINFFANLMTEKVPPLFYVLVMGISSTFAVAILKHRLMDITIIVRKTLIYSTVMSLLAGIYLATIFISTHIFEGITGYQTIFSSAVASGLIAFCFQPIRRRVQGAIDRKFFRDYVNREEKLYELSREVVTHTSPQEMGEALMRVINETLHPKSAALYFRKKNSSGFQMAAGIGLVASENDVQDDDSLANYLNDHPQPFAHDLNKGTSISQDTRKPSLRAKTA